MNLTTFKLLGSDLFQLLKSAKELLHPEPYSREEVCRILRVNEDELMFECLQEAARKLETFQIYNRIIHVISEAIRVYKFKSICDEANSAESSSPEQVNLLTFVV